MFSTSIDGGGSIIFSCVCSIDDMAAKPGGGVDFKIGR